MMMLINCLQRHVTVILICILSVVELSHYGDCPLESSLNKGLTDKNLQWGLEDAVCIVGKICRYDLPPARPGHWYNISSVDDITWPSWLYYDELTHSIVGIADPSEVDRSYYFHVEEIDKMKKLSSTDVFSITVKDTTHCHNVKIPTDTADNSMGDILCPVGSSVTSASITIDEDFSRLTPISRVELLQSVAVYLDMPDQLLYLYNALHKQLDLVKSSVLLVGPGNIEAAKHSGVVVQWNVGCGNVYAKFMPALEKLESHSHIADLSMFIERSISSWQIINSKVSIRPRRQVNAYYTATPEPSVPSPTRTAIYTSIITESSTEISSKPPSLTTEILESSIIPTASTEHVTGTIPTAVVSTTVSITDSTTTLRTTPTTTKPHKNQPPIARNPFTQFSTFVGSVIWFKVPSDTFYDEEDGDTDNLKLLLQIRDNEEDLTLPRMFWIKLNQSSQIIYGLPLDAQVGRHQFSLAAIDRQNEIVKFSFFVIVMQRPISEPVNHEMIMTFDLQYDKVLFQVETRVDMARKIAAGFGDQNADKMTILSIERGSVVYTWANKTMMYEPCPAEELKQFLLYLFLPNSKLNHTTTEKFAPYVLTSVEFIPRGTCKGYLTGQNATEEWAETRRRSERDETMLLYIIIPLAVLALLLLIILILCIACQKKKKSKSTEELNVKKGVPIIFADELEDKQLLKPLMEDEDEKQIPPPEYHQSTSKTSTLQSDYKEPLLSETETDVSSAKKTKSDTE